MEAHANRPMTQEDCQALDLLAGQVVQDGKLTMRLHDTTVAPTSQAAHAHRERLRLAQDAGCLDLAMDASVSMEAANSLERMLGHQLAAAHTQAMRLLASADKWLHQSDPSDGCTPLGRAQLASVEAARLTNAAARMTAAYQAGLLTLARLRTGGQQTVTVQHVHVSEGGQAVVAGSVTPGKAKRRR